MKLVLTGKQVDLSNAFKEMVAHELAYLKDILPDGKVVTVTVEDKPEMKASILFYHEQEVVNLAETGTDLYEVVPRLAKKLEKNMREFRKMKRAYVKNNKRQDSYVPMEHEEYEEGALPEVAKRKRFEMKPMSEAEAILQMNSLGHPQFIFSNDELDGQICLMYTRKDNTYGIIETTI